MGDDVTAAACNFIRPPTVGGREPIWENAVDQPVVVGLRQTFATCSSPRCSMPSPIIAASSPQPSVWPFLTAMAATALFHRLDLHALGRCLRRGAGIRHDGRLVLAERADEGGTQPWPIQHRTLPWGNERHPGPAAMTAPRILDVGGLPPGAFGSRSLTWWSTMGIVLIEGTVFAIAIGAYLYLRTRAPAWPPTAWRRRPVLGHSRTSHPAREPGPQRAGEARRTAHRSARGPDLDGRVPACSGSPSNLARALTSSRT
jgi:cytochrome c oxidase subunit 1/cytochrome c oxidase subunit I+III